MCCFPTASLVFLVRFSAQGEGEQGGGRKGLRSPLGDDNEGRPSVMFPSLSQKPGFCAAAEIPPCMHFFFLPWVKAERSQQQNTLGDAPLYRPDMKHSFPPDTPASGHSISSDLHSPPGVIHHIPRPYAYLQDGNPATWPFLLRSHWLNENLLF